MSPGDVLLITAPTLFDLDGGWSDVRLCKGALVVFVFEDRSWVNFLLPDGRVGSCYSGDVGYMRNLVAK